MKFIDEIDIERVNQTLNFNTADCQITGGCDLFTTKAVGSDKKLYKTIDKHLDTMLMENESYQQLQSVHEGTQFWEQKRRISVSEGNGTTPKLNDTELSNLVEDIDGYVSDHKEPFSTQRRPSVVAALGSQRRRSSVVHESISMGPFGPITETASRRTFAYLIAVLNASYPDHDFSSVQPTDFIKNSVKMLISKFENTMLSLGKQPEEWIWESINNHMDLGDCVIYQYKPESNSFMDDEPGHLWSNMWFLSNKKRKRVAFLYLNASRPTRRGSGDGEQKMEMKKRRSTLDEDDVEEYDLTYDAVDENAIEDDTEPEE